MLKLKIGGYPSVVDPGRSSVLVQLEETTPIFLHQQQYVQIKLDGSNVSVEAGGKVVLRIDVANVGPLFPAWPPEGDETARGRGAAHA